MRSSAASDVEKRKEGREEGKKVVWTARDDVFSSVKVVLISTVAVALFLGLLDMLFTTGFNFVF